MAGYIFIDRLNDKDLAVIYPDEQTAKIAITEDPLIELICSEDAVDCYVSTEPPKLKDRNLIPSDSIEWVTL